MVDSYVAIDLETTGLDPKRDKIIEVGAVKFLKGKETDRFCSFINPYRELEYKTTEITGITDFQLNQAPGIESVIDQVISFCDGFPLLGHHVIFDYSFLKKAAVNQAITFEKEGIDTLQLCRKFMPLEMKKNLKDACLFYGTENHPLHRAEEDARAASDLYKELKKRYGHTDDSAFSPKSLVYKVKKEQPAGKRQKEHLQDLLKYHKISLTADVEHLSRNEVSRMIDKIILQFGRI